MFRRIALLCLIFSLVGCGGSDKSVPQSTTPQNTGSQSSDTASVSKADLDTARATFHLKPDLQIEAKGYNVAKVTDVDTMIFFKFIAKTDKIENVFTTDVDTKKFHPGVLLLDHARLGWWDVVDKEFDGGRVEFANNQAIMVGYRDNKDGTLTVYTVK